ncbi:MAG: alpha/beta fold hydrolase [Solirubrobacterales bacterium]|nr:alpha/beta fold hydrolase [Solirubrobacterales bacterium]
MARMVLVHGAFGSSAVWDPVVAGLRERGHHVEAIDLPGAGDDAIPLAEVSLEMYAERACSALGGGGPAVLVGHSMGGVVVTQAAARCPEHVSKLIYVCAFIPADGQSLSDLTQLPEGAGDQVQANMVVEGEPPIATLPAAAAKRTLMCCCDERQADWAVATLRPQPVLPFTQPVTVGGRAFTALPRSYIICLRDQAIMPALQRRMLKAAGCAAAVELDTDHFPMGSRPDELAEAIDQLA